MADIDATIAHLDRLIRCYRAHTLHMGGMDAIVSGSATLIDEVKRLQAELDGAHATADAVFAERDQYMQGQTEATAIAHALRAELEKARLTLAAEQGRQEGAPSARWRFRVANGVGEWIGAVESTGGYQRVEPSRAWTGELVGWLLLTFDGLGHLVETTSHPNARAAMLAADAAVG